MKVLLVEDEDRSVRQTTAALAKSAPGATTTLASNRDDALRELDTDDFDLVLCDLRIPPSKESADVDERHGLAVYSAAREASPGTPLVFLTSFATPRNVKSQLSTGGVGNVYGMAGFPLVQLVDKGDVVELEELLLRISEALTELDAFCDLDADSIADPMFERAIRLYAKEIGHPTARVVAAAGLSGATVGRVTLTSHTAGEAAVFVKVLDHRSANDEYQRYTTYVPNRLQPGTFAPALPPMVWGLRKKAALVSTLADERFVSLFTLLSSDPPGAAAVVRELRQALASWHTGDPETLVGLGTLRRTRISDAQLRARGVDIDEILSLEDSVTVAMRHRIAHGDLHGENILVSPQGHPLLIDFGDVGRMYAPVDPVTLELSIIFHKHGPARRAWGEPAVWAEWPNGSKYSRDSPYAEFIRECREWANETATDAMCAFAYSHAIRQVKYSDVNPDIALAIARGAVAQIR